MHAYHVVSQVHGQPVLSSWALESSVAVSVTETSADVTEDWSCSPCRIDKRESSGHEKSLKRQGGSGMRNEKRVRTWLLGRRGQDRTGLTGILSDFYTGSRYRR